jgi:hypothetical protein
LIEGGKPGLTALLLAAFTATVAAAPARAEFAAPIVVSDPGPMVRDAQVGVDADGQVILAMRRRNVVERLFDMVYCFSSGKLNPAIASFAILF